MLYQYVGSIYGETIQQRKALSQVLAVDVAIYCAREAECRKAVGYLGGTDVARVPDFVAFSKVLFV